MTNTEKQEHYATVFKALSDEGQDYIIAIQDALVFAQGKTRETPLDSKNKNGEKQKNHKEILSCKNQ